MSYKKFVIVLYFLLKYFKRVRKGIKKFGKIFGYFVYICIVLLWFDVVVCWDIFCGRIVVIIVCLCIRCVVCDGMCCIGSGIVCVSCFIFVCLVFFVGCKR